MWRRRAGISVERGAFLFYLIEVSAIVLGIAGDIMVSLWPTEFYDLSLGALSGP
jgi:hypothetical protein